MLGKAKYPSLSSILSTPHRWSLVLGAASFLAFLILTYRLTFPSKPPTDVRGFDHLHTTWNLTQERLRLTLNHDQCSLQFPRLYDDIDRAVRDTKGRNGAITLQDLESVSKINGYVRGMVYDNELYIIDKQGGIYSRELATLNALYRAIITSTEQLPNIEFTFISDDKIPSWPTWAYARRKEHKEVWLIPDFGFWAWPETKVGSYDALRKKIVIREDGDVSSGKPSHPFESKKDQLVWRGATMGLPLREEFIASTVNRTWADVKAINWHDHDSMHDDLLSIEDHCMYKYVAHTEGNSYSGRLKYLQNCRSVVVAHPMDWIQHYQHLMIPSGPEQNYVQVRRDFSDLEKKMTDLLSHEEEASRIADNSVKMFRDTYLTPAAQVCYWRRLIQAWASVSFEPHRFDSEGNLRGVPFEDFVLERRLEWDPY